MNILETILNPLNNFEKRVLNLHKSIGIDGAFYFVLGQFESEFNFELPDIMSIEGDEVYEELADKIINKYPSLEF